MMKAILVILITLLFCRYPFVNATEAGQEQKADILGGPDNPIIISLLPEQTLHKIDDLPLPDILKISPRQKLSFKLVQSETYNKSVDDFCHGSTHLAVLSMITYAELKKRCNIEELLAIEILEGQAAHYSGIFTHRRNLIGKSRTLSLYGIKNKTIAFGSRYSTTSFHYPVKLLLDFGMSLPDDLDEIYITGSHFGAIDKLVKGEVELAAASFQSWKAAIDNRSVDPMQFMPLIKSNAIPLPPLVMNRHLPDKIKEQIRKVFKEAHAIESTEPLVGLRGQRIIRYDVEAVDNAGYLDSLQAFSTIELDLVNSVLKKAKINEVVEVDSVDGVLQKAQFDEAD